MVTGISRRTFGRAAAGAMGLAVAGAAAHENVEPSWSSEDPHLSGAFAPVAREADAADLPVTAGRIPPELRGDYMRNGPNPMFKPISYSYPMDGDGMIHAVYLDNGRARYRNRFVQTRSLAVEKHAGRAVYGGLMHPVPVDPSLVGPDGNPGPVKNGAFINVMRHGDHLLALDEASRCYEMTMELDTVGEWTAGTGKPIELGAHNRRHPQTGALFALAYSVTAPQVRFHQIDPTGRLVQTFTVTLAAPTMIHDFILTERHIVLLACPLVFDLKAAQARQPLLQWRPAMGTRIGLIALDGSTTTWVDADPFFVFHFANGHERGGRIVIDYVRHDGFGPGYGGARPKPPTLHRLSLDLATRRVDDTETTGLPVEFPRINDAREALPNRFVFLPTLSETLRLPDPPSATFNTMLKVDSETGAVARHDFGNQIAGEAVFVPRRRVEAEDDGYLAVFTYDPVNRTSDFVLLDAAHIEADPVAVVRLPQRVPAGLHGNWIPL